MRAKSTGLGAWARIPATYKHAPLAAGGQDLEVPLEHLLALLSLCAVRTLSTVTAVHAAVGDVGHFEPPWVAFNAVTFYFFAALGIDPRAFTPGCFPNPSSFYTL